MLLYALSIFLGAFLLFLVQPMMAQFILPWFGGSSLVWTTCMLFFQTGLVIGYAYAHGVSRKISPRSQWLVHVIFVSAAVICLPIRPSDAWKPTDGSLPTWRILWLLLVNVGLPYCVLATTGPLMQRWQSLSHPTHSPYRLFALSNLGSLLALLAYPLVLESYFTLELQSLAWSAGFALYAVCVIGCGFGFQYRVAQNDATRAGSQAAELERCPLEHPAFATKITWRQQWSWFLLPMLASIQLLATTNFLTQEIGAHPFLWILPLALYLLTFIISFEYERLYIRSVFYTGLCGTALLACWVFHKGLNAEAILQGVAYCGVLFFAAMICHGELARRKPTPQHLTIYYLWIAIGGAAGGVFVALLAPILFNDFFEFHLSLILIVVLTLPTIVVDACRDYQQLPRSKWKIVAAWFTITGGAVACSGVAASGWQLMKANTQSQMRLVMRNEYGVVKVEDSKFERALRHGHTKHGIQLKDESWRLRPTSYYSPDSGLGLAFRMLQGPRDKSERLVDFDSNDLDISSLSAKFRIRIGVVGLGTGSIATWARAKDELTFFEIDPKVIQLAQQEFTYLRDCRSLSPVKLVPGDARIQLELEKQRSEPRYDLLVVDAFSSDSIPKHLLTKEAIQLYLERTEVEGAVAIHVSNRFLNLAPVVKQIADQLQIPALYVYYKPPTTEHGYYYDYSSWVVLTNNPEFLANPVVQSATSKFPELPAQSAELIWTDDFMPLLPLLK